MKIKNFFKKLSVVAIIAVLLLGSFNLGMIESYAEEAEFKIKIANSNSPFTNINGQDVMDAINAGCYAFENYVEQASGGRINVEIYDSGVLGGSSEGLSQCMQNVVQACVTGDGELATLYPKLQVLSIPYLFDNRTEFYNLLDSKWMGNLFNDINQELGIRLLAASDNGGFRSISNNVREIKTADDLAGLKIRSMQIPAYVKMLESMGAIATPIAWAELYTSLQTGVVDGEENAPTTIMNGSLHEVQKYYTLDKHSISSLVLMMNDEFYSGLPKDLQNVVSDGGKIAQIAMRGANNANEALALQGLIDSGLQVYIPTEEEKLTFKEASQEPVIDWLKTELSPEFVDSFMNAVVMTEAGTEIATVNEETKSTEIASDSTSKFKSNDTIRNVINIVAILAILFAAFVVVKAKKAAK